MMIHTDTDTDTDIAQVSIPIPILHYGQTWAFVLEDVGSQLLRILISEIDSVSVYPGSCL